MKKTTFFALVSIFLIFIQLNGVAVTKTFVSGNWNSAASWSPSGVPGNNDDVVIPSGTTVTVNCNCGTYSGMRVYVHGTMTFNNGKKINLAADGELHIFAGGKLTGGNGGSKFNIGSTSVYRGSDPDLTGPNMCTSSGCGGTPTHLPVNLISFLSKTFEDRVDLEWSTASEIDNDYFIIERKGEGDWISIGQVSGNGTTNELHFYTYSDYEVDVSELAYYRLKQIDYNGEADLSHIIQSDVIKTQGHNYKFVQNGSSLSLTFIDNHDERTQIQILNSSGAIIYSKTSNNVQIGDVITFDLQGFPFGWYVVGIIGSDNAHFEKMIYVK